MLFRSARLRTQALSPISEAVSDFMNKKFKGRTLLVGLDWPFLGGSNEIWLAVIWSVPEMTGIELTGKTIGLVGMGNIPLRTGEILKNGFDTVLVGYDPYCTAEQAAIFGIKKYNDLNKMLEVSDIVNISVPLTPSTKNLIAGDSFLHFKKNAVLINAARGGIVNEDDLYTA